jgi:hypothetical protein
MNNVIHTIWKSEALRGHQLNESFDIFYSRLPTWRSGVEKISDYSIDKLLLKASKNPDLDWAVVHGEGTVYRSQIEILRTIESFISTLDPNILVAGQLINKPGRYCGIHEQCFIVNLKTYRKLGHPIFGDYTDEEKELHNYTAGPSVHDNYTPLFLNPREGRQNYQLHTCGWSFVNASMENGLSIPNISPEIRMQKIYCYPNDETDLFLNNMEALYSINPTQNISQNRFLALLLLKKLGLHDTPTGKALGAFPERKSGVFIFNTERPAPNRTWVASNLGEISCYIGTCAGFTDISSLRVFGCHENTKLIYFDINQDSIFFKEQLFQHFDGDLEKLPAFIKKFRQDHPEIVFADNSDAIGLEHIYKEFTSPADFHNLWKKMQKMDKKFLRLNLLSELKKLSKSVPKGDERVFLSISDIFTGTNEMLYGVENLRNIFLKLLNSFRSRNNMIIQGKDIWGVSFMGYPSNLLDQYALKSTD